MNSSERNVADFSHSNVKGHLLEIMMQRHKVVTIPVTPLTPALLLKLALAFPVTVKSCGLI
jgi:hypothetical protein